jgi:hypothetical protein
MRRGISIALVTLVGVLGGTAACGDSNVAGNYSAAITNGPDGCSIGWNAGEQTMATFTVTQSDGDITLTVTGFAASVFVASLVGNGGFTGEVDGDSIEVVRNSTLTPTRIDNCEFTYNAKIIGDVDGDSMKGRVEYRAATNDHADCGSRTSCLSRQDFNASRPPSSD